MELKIVDKDEDGIGEILVKVENITKGYFENETATRENIIDGWMHTGDLGKIDNEGFLYICGRNSDMIVLSNGKEIFPNEIEYFNYFFEIFKHNNCSFISKLAKKVITFT